MFKIFFLIFILIKRQRQTQRDRVRQREIFHVLVHLLNAYKSQGQARLKQGSIPSAGSPMWVAGA